MKFLKNLLATFASAALLAGCGGGSAWQPSSGCTTGTVGGTGTSCTTGAAVASIAVSASSPTIAADGSTSSTITAILRDANQNFVSGATVTFAASQGGGLSVASPTSDATGTVTATLTSVGATAGSTITVTATSGTASGTTSVAVSSTTKTLTLTTSTAQIPSDGSKTATITALVRDANNNVISGVPVGFKADSGLIAITQGTTDATGAATATLSAGGDYMNRTITVTASLATGTPVTVPVSVTGTSLSLTGTANIVFGSPGNYSATLTDASGNGITGKPVTFTSANGNTLSAASVNTDVNGHATVQLTAVKAGNDTVTAAALGLTATAPVVVSSQSFAFTAPAPAPAAPPQVNINTNYTVSVTWTNGGAPVAGQSVTFATTRGAFVGSATATTNGQGVATAVIAAGDSGVATVTATGTGVSAQSSIDFLATTPATVTLQPSLTSVPAQGTSTIVAVVRDANYNLVEGKTVDFTVIDPTGGVLSVPNAVTDTQGRAQTIYTAGSSSSAQNGVTITATVQNFPAATSSTTLTVGGQTVFLSLGTGNTIDGSTSQSEYSQPWVVRALDASGHSIPSQTVTVATRSVSYYKGDWISSTPTDTFKIYATCGSEDLNNNGILDAGEDVNGNGKLDPGSVATPVPGSGQTDATGAFNFLLYYPKSVCNVVTIELSVTAVVNGTQSQTEATYTLPCLAADITPPLSPPSALGPATPPNPGDKGWYGDAAVCTDPN